jgi:hypothetical protein
VLGVDVDGHDVPVLAGSDIGHLPAGVTAAGIAGE